MLRKYHPIWINTHFNPSPEITPEAERACEAIVDAGIPLGNQSVLLRGINDNAETMKELLLKLVHMRVRPYYLYQCDLSVGISHFRTDVDTGIDIIHRLTEIYPALLFRSTLSTHRAAAERSSSVMTTSSARATKKLSSKLQG